ncbi:winged helix-turn-helix domain-containing protein [Actinoplanes sp. TRM 88003]|uniref:Winged helix-turn-helix domain-containing protein n=1 Tax=Paractinoplanes aksuensis TaxID=2939490 RepID=A0ABT1DUA5_9ACTN|nr:winged helix-turn-helix domain-containing protein [Actinoplanes aksuensis]MCO8274403.1 winged helix-turn-helix domain-containing protein [Actinoplanes aksuensis]
MTDELSLDFTPVLLNPGERKFDGVEYFGYKPVKMLHSPLTTRIRYRRVGGLLYVQLADLLAGMIERGELKEGDPLPSESYLQQEYGLARGTVRSAVRLLRERDMVTTAPQRGTYVNRPQPDPSVEVPGGRAAHRWSLPATSVECRRA